MRNGVIATVVLETAEKYRTREEEYKHNFYAVLKKYERNRDKYEVDKRLGFGFKVFTSNAEMVNRLMLLISSNESGNESTEIGNEITDIIDHLRTIGLLTSNEYEILHKDLIA